MLTLGEMLIIISFIVISILYSVGFIFKFYSTDKEKNNIGKNLLIISGIMCGFFLIVFFLMYLEFL